MGEIQQATESKERERGETIGEGRRLGRAGERERGEREEREVVSDSGFSKTSHT